MSLVVNNIKKSHKNGVTALDDLSIEIGKGMFGLLGPNGAGKSTFMRILATLQVADSGHITFQGIDILQNPKDLRSRLGYLPQSFGVYPKESAKFLLHYMAVLKGISNKQQRTQIVDEVLDLTNLTDVQDQFVSEYSGGMKQRFGIAQLLLNRPSLIIVDEPTAGLDPSERKRFLNVLRAVGTENTVIFSTHIVEDVRELCNDMAIINHGKILKHQSPRQAIDDLQGTIWQTKVTKAGNPILKRKHTVISENFSDDNQLLARVFATEKPTGDFRPAPPTLEDVYFLTLGDSK
ncbi:ABC transporter ATP-binding protein [Rhodohalobacter barkolensis]|uniref:Multidrug ABC transporter ATP-binding protein n=1 Tax=Rhodohalobacter barkolensis TaxID=2053187 RepID=A0A2N0VJB8_9BACT|nr:ABC transporter ATP-binding protein [Rhodohalobacter barkolensis]PKD44238.1 multidrug ABC transporter ATP-binding protein [Rhodohalobacter barkolensis]